MGGRTYKQQRASFNRIKLETKTTKQAQDLIRKQYSQLGRKVPQKIQNETATIKDIERYMQTLRNAYDRKVAKEELKREGNNVGKKLNELNRLHKESRKALANQLSGYNPDFIQNLASGKEVVIGYDMSFSIPPLSDESLERVKSVAKFNGKPVSKMLDMKIENAKETLESINKLSVDKQFVLEQYKNIMEENGFVISSKNEETLKRYINELDFLGEMKALRYLHTKHQNTVYAKYKEELEENDNEKLMLNFISDLNQSRKMTIQSRSRFIT